MSDLIVRKSKIRGAGKGLFAGRNFKKCEILGYYKGKKLNRTQFDKLKDTSYVWTVKINNKEKYIDGKYSKCKLKFVNGVKTKKQKMKTNLIAYQYKHEIFYKTTREIKKGEEFLINYGDFYW